MVCVGVCGCVCGGVCIVCVYLCICVDACLSESLHECSMGRCRCVFVEWFLVTDGVDCPVLSSLVGLAVVGWLVLYREPPRRRCTCSETRDSQPRRTRCSVSVCSSACTLSTSTGSLATVKISHLRFFSSRPFDRCNTLPAAGGANVSLHGWCLPRHRLSAIARCFPLPMFVTSSVGVAVVLARLLSRASARTVTPHSHSPITRSQARPHCRGCRDCFPLPADPAVWLPKRRQRLSPPTTVSQLPQGAVRGPSGQRRRRWLSCPIWRSTG